MGKILLVIGLLISISPYENQNPSRKSLTIDPMRRKKGEEIWELAIAAKGGREKLEEVKSLAYLNGPTDGDFIVFPDRFFRWADARGMGRHGFLTMSHFNFSTRIEYSLIIEGEMKSQEIKKRDLHSTSISNLKTWFEPYQLHYFLGIKWFPLKVVDWQQRMLYGRKVDWVRLYPATDEGGKDDIGVYLDLATHLPIRVEHYAQYRYGEQVYDFIELKDYQINKGIMMPTKVKTKGGKQWSALEIEINPEYDPLFFEKPPEVSQGFNQWRLKK